MRILVTGGAGFIGSHTVDLLLDRNYDVRILDALRPPVHQDAQIPDYVPRDDVEFVHGDVRDQTTWIRVLNGVEAVFHLAAYQDYLPDFSTFFHTNTVSTAHLYEVIVSKRLPIRKVVIASSQAVYGEGKYRCHGCESVSEAVGARLAVRYPPGRDERDLAEGRWDVKCPQCGASMEAQWTDETVANPYNQYAISKYSQEMVALNLGRRYGIPTVCMRYSIVQGPRQSFRNAYSGVLRIFAQQVLNGRPPICYEDGQQVRDYVSVYDVARSNVLALEDDRADFQAFNVGGNRRVTVLEYARLIARRANTDIAPQIPGRYRSGDNRHIFSDITKLKALGWEPTASLEDIIDEYLAWAKAQPGFRDFYAEAEARMAACGTIRTLK